MSTERAINLQF